MKTILIIDDDPVVREYFQDQFQSAGYKVCLAANANDATTAIKENQPQLITLDLNMPDTDGFELCRQMRDMDEAADLPIIMITGEEGPEIKQRAFQSGVSEFFSKKSATELIVDYVDELFKTLALDETQKSGRVLIVEDSKFTRLTIKRLLLSENLDILEAGNVDEALRLMQENEIDLVLTDIEMPGADGFELIKKLRADNAFNAVQIITMSSLSEQSAVVKAFLCGANDYIHKPFQRDELFARIKSHLKVAQLQQETQKNNKYLANLNEQKDKFIGIAAHDLRNPLSGIYNASDLLLQGAMGEVNERQQTMVKMIHDSANAMFELLNGLLNVNKIETGNFEPELSDTNVQEFINNTLMINDIAAKQKSISIEQEINIEKEIISIDQSKLEQVLGNFLSNAIKYSQPNSTIKLRVRADNQQFRVEVEDEGGGIDPKEESGVFDQFSKISTVPTAGESSHGLGLSICKFIVEAHQGKIGLKNLHPKGCNFYFEIPMS